MFSKLVYFLIFRTVFGNTLASDLDDCKMHPRSSKLAKESRIDPIELDAKFWNDHAQETILASLKRSVNTNVAKNVILFLGDGMSIPTVKATRVYLGQLDGKAGEETTLAFEKFPYVGLSKTYCVDSQTADSACSATAYLCGSKANDGTIGVTARVSYKDCTASLNKNNHVYSTAHWFQQEGKRAGLVTTTRVTHASPAGVYSHVSCRDWESNADVDPLVPSHQPCEDIALQLIHGETGKKLKVILGGGRREFTRSDERDEESDYGRRTDGRNLIEEWKVEKKNSQYVWNVTALKNIPNNTEYLLGLFESSHCKYHLDADIDKPSLEEMTVAAIKLLSKGSEGYFLFVEGGRIDHAHHDTLAHRALDETVEFSKAIQKAREITNEDDTLIVVTSDHAHTMSVSGYPPRGNDIFGIASMGTDGLPLATVTYANGPGYKEQKEDRRHDVTLDDMTHKDYKFPALGPLESETHGGDDVGIFASGPWAHLFVGVMEQNVIAHTMNFAACVGEGLTACNDYNSGVYVKAWNFDVYMIIFIIIGIFLR